MSDNRFVLVSPARSGSTMLRIMLQRLNDVSCCGEAYAKSIVRGSISKSGLEKSRQFELRNEDEQAFLEDIGFIASQHTGIKILYEQLLSPWAANFTYFLSQHPQIKIIHLSRRDMSARYFSEVLHQTRAMNRDATESTVIEHHTTARQMYLDAQRIIATSKLVDWLFREHRVHHVYYEDILYNEESRGQLLSFLGYESLAEHFVIPEHIVNASHSLVDISVPDKAALVAEFKALMQEQTPDLLA